ncbi:MAG: alpha/beta fold hydrolase [Candidatus Pacebacteria bacterium]|nr:alpha/beta fold hydrolase [Candidatus Paceibacterota bacterium]
MSNFYKVSFLANFKTKRSKHAKGILFLLFWFSLLLNIRGSAFAKNIFFKEDFNTLNSDTWQAYEKEGQITLEAGKILLAAEKTSTFPFVAYRDDIPRPFPNQGDFTLKVGFKYNRVESKGVGFAIGTKLPPYHTTTDTPINNPLYSQYKFFQIWQDNVYGLILSYTGTCYNTPNCSLSEIIKFQSNGIDLDFHFVELKYKDNKYSIFIDDELKYVSPETLMRPDTIWFGNNSTQGIGDLWTSLTVDSILIYDMEYTPLIFLPGMTACWNKGLISGENGENWHLFSPARFFFYHNLINAFYQAGLEKDQDWHLFCYDWRKPFSDNAAKLKEFVEAKTDPTEKVDLVGHSMGGMISRVFAQANPDKTEKLITLGSPHQGAVHAYAAWEGGQIWEVKNLYKLFLETLLFTNKKPGEHPKDTIRRAFPSVADLLPTHDFLIDSKSGLFKDVADHIHQNQTLSQLNQTFSQDLKNKTSLFYGYGFPTLESIKVSSITTPHANWAHYALGLWEDGEPIHFCPGTTCEYNDRAKDYSSAKIYSNQGDETVLVKSATFNGVQAYDFALEHNDLVKEPEAIQQLFGLLDLSPNPTLSPLEKLKNALIFLIRSPAKILITDIHGNQIGHQTTGPEISNAFYDSEANFVLIPNPLDETYQIRITGTGQGYYRLLLGRLDTDENVEIREYQFPTHQLKVDSFLLDPAKPNFSLEDPEGLNSFQSAKARIFELNLENCKIIPFLNLLEKSLKQQKFNQAKSLVQTSLIALNHCFLKQEQEEIVKSFPGYEGIINDLFDTWKVIVSKAKVKLQPKITDKKIWAQEKILQKLAKDLQRKTDKGQTIPLIKVIYFEYSNELLEKAREALEQNQSDMAWMYNFQLMFFLPKLLN